MTVSNRREFLRDLGVGAAVVPFLSGLPSLRAADSARSEPAKRLVVMFSPNGTLPDEFWPETFGGELALTSMLSALEPVRDQTLVLKGVHNLVRGDGDSHMRGMSCLLTGTELNPGNIQGGGHTPAGWAGGIRSTRKSADSFSRGRRLGPVSARSNSESPYPIARILGRGCATPEAISPSRRSTIPGGCWRNFTEAGRTEKRWPASWTACATIFRRCRRNSVQANANCWTNTSSRFVNWNATSPPPKSTPNWSIPNRTLIPTSNWSTTTRPPSAGCRST